MEGRDQEVSRDTDGKNKLRRLSRKKKELNGWKWIMCLVETWLPYNTSIQINGFTYLCKNRIKINKWEEMSRKKELNGWKWWKRRHGITKIDGGSSQKYNQPLHVGTVITMAAGQ